VTLDATTGFITYKGIVCEEIGLYLEGCYDDLASGTTITKSTYNVTETLKNQKFDVKVTRDCNPYLSINASLSSVSNYSSDIMSSASIANTDVTTATIFPTPSSPDCSLTSYELIIGGVLVSDFLSTDPVRFDSSTGQLIYTGNTGRVDNIVVRARSDVTSGNFSIDFTLDFVDIVLNCLNVMDVPTVSATYLETTSNPPSFTN
jgi:hypothetical protein